jgi:hypothetical protein
VRVGRRAEPCGNPRRRRPRPWGGAQSGEEARRVAVGDGGGGERWGGMRGDRWTLGVTD